MATIICKGSRSMEVRRGDGIQGWVKLKSLMELKNGDSFRTVSQERKRVGLVYKALSDPFMLDDIPMIEVERVYMYTGWKGFRKPNNNRPWGSRKKVKDKRSCHHMAPLGLEE